MFKSNNKPTNPSCLSPVCRRRILKYKESFSKSFPGFSPNNPLLKSPQCGRNMATGRHWLPSPQLMRKSYKSYTQKMRRGRPNSQWTKIRHSLDFIRKSKQMQKCKKYSQDEEILKRSKSLQFLGKLYGDRFMDPLWYQSCI